MNLRKDHYWINDRVELTPWSMCLPYRFFYSPLWTFCRLFMIFGSLTGVHWRLALRCLTLPLSYQSMIIISTLQFMNVSLLVFNTNKLLYNFQQRISWLSHRWRTQRNAISNVNCRIQWIIESLNAPCTLWYSEEYACLSVIKFSSYFYFEGSLDVRVAGFTQISSL